MSRRSLLFVGLVALVLAVPVASAKDCTTGIEPVCDMADSMQFDAVFGDYGDYAVLFLLLFAAVAVINLLIWILLHITPSRLLKLGAAEKVREIEPGGVAKFKLELENQNKQLPVDVFLEGGELPDGWKQQVDAAVVLPSEFRLPQTIGETGSFTLSSAPRGSNRAIVTVRLAAPAESKQEETVDYTLRAVPVYRGRLRKGKSKRIRLSVLVTPHLPVVQISKVEHNPNRIQVGNPVQTKALLVNKGDRAANDVAVSFSLNGTELDKKVVPSLASQGAAEVEFNWTPQPGENKIRVALAT